MNRNGQCCSTRLLLLLPLLLLLLIIDVVVCEDEISRTQDNVYPDIAGLRTALDDIFDSGTAEGHRGNALRAGRTFGHKRIQFMMMPMIYKMGVMMTMLAVLTVISLKGLMIGIVLLVLKLSMIFGKFYAHHAAHSAPAWIPPQPSQPQPVHVHVHSDLGYGSHSQAYSTWEAQNGGSGGGGGGYGGGGPPTVEESYYYKG